MALAVARSPHRPASRAAVRRTHGGRSVAVAALVVVIALLSLTGASGSPQRTLTTSDRIGPPSSAELLGSLHPDRRVANTP
jgi:hypothetical protein